MGTFQELYEKALKLALAGREDEIGALAEWYDPNQLDCLLYPKKHPLVIPAGPCTCDPAERDACAARCPFGALRVGAEGVEVDADQCLGCAGCIDGCAAGRLKANTEVLPAIQAVRRHKGLCYALIAPAFQGQFPAQVTPGRLRSAFKAMGFDGMIEVALFADILTLREALEFDRSIHTEADFQLTSCCCPMWIGMIRKIYHELVPHVPGSVSPMVACARTIKALYPDALTVFIGPCLAKKAEAREKDLAGAVDFVLTFREAAELFEALGIDPAAMEESEKDHSSRCGRIYARKGGVSEAVRETLARINPGRTLGIRTRQADGVPACREMIGDILAGRGGGNFYEGMGCKGGCVGGARALVGAEQGARAVDAYGEAARCETPAENPYVMELLRRLGFDTIESLLNDTDLFARRL